MKKTTPEKKALTSEDIVALARKAGATAAKQTKFWKVTLNGLHLYVSVSGRRVDLSGFTVAGARKPGKDERLGRVQGLLDDPTEADVQRALDVMAKHVLRK